MISMPGLKKLEIIESNLEINNLSVLTDLKELYLRHRLDVNDIKTLETNLLNLEIISIILLASDDLLPFLRCLSKLKKLFVHLNHNSILNLTKLNKEREQLGYRRKVTIFVENDVFEATKWATRNGYINFSLIEMRRRTSQLDFK